MLGNRSRKDRINDQENLQGKFPDFAATPFGFSCTVGFNAVDVLWKKYIFAIYIAARQK
jgi:hypothetical protein